MRKNGFTLVEVVLAIGVATFCLIAILGLLPAGIQVARDSRDSLTASQLLHQALADIRAVQAGNANTPQFGLSLAGSSLGYFSVNGVMTNQGESYFAMQSELASQNNNLVKGRCVVWWPSRVDLSKSAGFAEAEIAVAK